MEITTEITQAERHARHKEMILSHAVRRGQRHENHAKRRKARSVIPITLK